jgi:hypothetical protein
MGPSELGAFPLGEALINMRLTLRCAEKYSIIPRSLRITLEELSRKTHFLERSYANLFAHAEATVPHEYLPLLGRLQEWVTGHAVDQKRFDAIGLLRWLANTAPEGRRGRSHQSTHPFILTEAWADDLEASGFDLKL